MRVLFVSSEIYPLAKTGGLADVSAALPKALAALGVEMRLLLPGYPKAIATAANKSVEVEVEDFMGAGSMRLISARTPDTVLPIWLVDCPSLFGRSGGPVPGRGRARLARQCKTLHGVQPCRRSTFARPVSELAGRDYSCQRLAFRAGSRDLGRNLRSKACDIVHNAQPRLSGLFPADLYPQLGSPGDSLMPDGLEFYGKVSFLKAGITYSDRLTTVSPTYAREILAAEYGFGLEGLLQRRAKDLVGILNGTDDRIWDPASDALFSVVYLAGLA